MGPRHLAKIRENDAVAPDEPIAEDDILAGAVNRFGDDAGRMLVANFDSVAATEVP